ncbi:universal stress protein [Actinosynnema sp. NPDC059335]|uniref:universal stress protein n=1 Tax=Actinosynnema sp. NPDC059335 TaxID=3346804 RepID=UPI00366AD716
MNGTVVVGVDGSDSALDAVRWAAERARTGGARLRLVHAETPLVGEVAELDGRTRVALHDQASQWVREAADAARDVDPDVRLDVRLQVADPVPLLLAESIDADLLVLGSRGLGGFTSLLLGSTAIAVTDHGGCPVVVVRGSGGTGPVVCGVEEENPAVLDRAFEEASARGVPLVAVRAWHAPPGPLAHAAGVDLAERDAQEGRKLARHLGPWREEYPDVAVEPVVARGNAARALVERARDAALLVVGCHGRGTLSGLLPGSTTHALLHHAPCPVLVVRATGREER